MASLMKKQAEKFLREKKRHRRWLAMFLCLALLVTSGTFAALRMDGRAMDYESGELDCRLRIHVHTEKCYDGDNMLTCGKADCVVHTHDAECIDENGEIICPLPEKEAHAHGDSCYTEEKILTCQQEETDGHQHSEKCYIEETGDPICGSWEHTHIGECYDEYGDLICGQEEHQHSESCFAKDQILTCTEQEGSGHTHDESCYKTEKTLTCEKEELKLHTHDENTCYDENGALACGQLELKEHQHGPECFEDKEDGADGPEETVPPTPIPTVSGSSISDGAVSDSSVSGGTVSDGTLSGNDVSGNAVSGNTVSENTISENMVSKNTARKKAPSKRSEDAVSEDAISWGGLQSKYADVQISGDDEGNVRTWDVSSTSHRYLEIPVRINISAATGTKITLPCYILDNVGRTVSANGEEYTHRPAIQREGIREEDWGLEIDETGNTATLTSKGQHASLDVFYKFDCWNIISDREFTIPCKVAPEGGGETSYELKGKIRTGHDVEFADYLNGVGNSDYGFDGFGGADKKTAYIPKWNRVYETYFGLTKEMFESDKENYVYDIAAFAVRPEHQQPYDIKGTFVPMDGGQLVGGVYMMDSRKRPDALCVNLASGSFEISHEQLKLNEGRRYAVVSDLSDENDNKVYTLYFLVKYPKQPPEGEQGPHITLKAKLELVHKGIDNHEEKMASNETVLYDGVQTPEDRIYWAAYLRENTENRTGLSSLLDQKNATVDFTADFFCLNENRSNFNEEDPEKYRLEAVIDLSYLPEAEDKPMLGENDYQFSSYSLSLIDAEGAWSHNSHGVPNVGWKPEKYGAAPGWAQTEMIKIYGSKSLTDQRDGAWELIKKIPASQVWVEDVDRSIKKENENLAIPKVGYVRLKVVYDSRLTTALRVGYQMELKPSDFWTENAQGLEELKVRSWFNYLAYDKEGNADPASKWFYRHPVNDTADDTVQGTAENGTIELARQHDAQHEYPGYGVPEDSRNKEYSLRNRANVTLKKGGDAAGMLVTQALYDSSGKVVGTGSKPGSQTLADSYSKKNEVSNASEIVYSISGVVTNDANSWDDLQSYQGKVTEDSPYKAMKQRYYVLLPEGLTLNMDPDKGEVGESGEPKYHFWAEGTDRYLSPWANFYNGNSAKVLNSNDTVVPVSKGMIKGWKEESPGTKGNVSEMYWWNAGSVEQNSEKSKGQLFVFDRTLTDGACSQFNLWGNPIFGWGQGLSFSVVPKRGTGALNEGDYTVQFWCQFLDENGDPIPINDFIRENNGEAEDLKEAYGGNIDDSTLVYIPSTFINHSAAGSSKTEISLSGKDVSTNEENGRNEVTLGGKYQYELKYSINNGKSKDVVLWCNIEGYDHNGEHSEWKGLLTGVDLKGNQDVEVYVQEEEININEYLRNGCGVGWLTADKGWKKVDPSSYNSYDWGAVRSIAFSFKGRTFDSMGNQEASVFLNMQAPQKEGVVTYPYQDVYTAYNEFIFSDSQGSALEQTQPGRGISEYTQLDMRVPVEIYELPSTGGGGIYWYTISGLLLMIGASLILYRNRSRERGCWETGR